jgi:acylphosphatase
MSNANIARRYIVQGRVQGVGFRWFVQREAQMLGLSGWVRNNMDGNVEVLAVGTDEQLEALAAKLKSGPRAARVDHVAESSASAENVAGFRIEGAW